MVDSEWKPNDHSEKFMKDLRRYGSADDVKDKKSSALSRPFTYSQHAAPATQHKLLKIRSNALISTSSIGSIIKAGKIKFIEF